MIRAEMIRAEMISGFTPTWYPQRRGVGQHVPGGYGHLVQNCKVKGFRCSRGRVPVQICSGLKDRGCLARPSGTDSPDSWEQNCSERLLEQGTCANLFRLKDSDALQCLQGRIRRTRGNRIAAKGCQGWMWVQIRGRIITRIITTSRRGCRYRILVVTSQSR